jgi:hypothetical protein
MAPGRGRGHLCRRSLIFKKNFLFSVLSDLSVLMTPRPIYFSQVSFLIQPFFVMIVLPAYTNRLKKVVQKFFFISIHKPPASIIFALMKHALAVTVEPLKFSPAEPVAYELSYKKD